MTTELFSRAIDECIQEIKAEENHKTIGDVNKKTYKEEFLSGLT